MIIRCYAVGREGDWEAVCLDFCLAVQGESFEEVRARLNESIEGYLEYVETLPEAEQRAFLRRRAPLSQRLEFYWIMLDRKSVV